MKKKEKMKKDAEEPQGAAEKPPSYLEMWQNDEEAEELGPGSTCLHEHLSSFVNVYDTVRPKCTRITLSQLFAAGLGSEMLYTTLLFSPT